MLKQLSIHKMGTDVEFFLVKGNANRTVPAHKFFEAKEEAPKWLGWSDKSRPHLKSSVDVLRADPRFSNVWYGGPCEEYSFYRDGVALEVNISPSICRAYMWDDLKLALATAMACKLKGHSEIRLTASPVAKLTAEQMETFPADCRILRCKPTLDAYAQKQKEIVVDPLKLRWRSSGAHLHHSWVGSQPEENWGPIIKLADLLMGVPFAYIFGDKLEFKRRTLYGQAGEFRFQQYPNDITGLEYRVLSSRLYNHPGIYSLFSGIWRYVVCANYSLLWASWDKSWEPDIQEAINMGTEKLFKPLLKKGTDLMHKVCGTYGAIGCSLTHKEEMWDRLRELNSKEMFPDVGIINHLGYPEGHKGWNEYRREWEI